MTTSAVQNTVLEKFAACNKRLQEAEGVRDFWYPPEGSITIHKLTEVILGEGEWSYKNPAPGKKFPALTFQFVFESYEDPATPGRYWRGQKFIIPQLTPTEWDTMPSEKGGDQKTRIKIEDGRLQNHIAKLNGVTPTEAKALDYKLAFMSILDMITKLDDKGEEVLVEIRAEYRDRQVKNSDGTMGMQRRFSCEHINKVLHPDLPFTG